VRLRLGAWLLLSLAVHVALAGVTFAALRVVAPAMVFVDLVHDLVAGAEPAASSREARPRESPATPRAPSVRPSPPPAPAVAAAPVPTIPPPTSVPAPPPPADAPREIPAPDPVPVLPARPAEAPPVVAPREPPAPAAPAGVGPAPSVGATEALPPAATGSASPPAAGDAAPRAAAGAGPPDGVLPGPAAAVRGQPPGGAPAGPDPRRGEGSAVALAIPGPGGAGDLAEYAGYYALLRRRVLESLTYPPTARRRGISGTVHLDLEIQPSGAISRVEVVASSSHRVLDDAAVAAVHDLGRLPFPGHVQPRLLRVRLPIVFRLR
jgi:TonB family protein